jgi:hypothetical protein
MESFFLSETTKYLYLLFDTDNFIHNNGAHATIIDTPRGQCVIDAGNFISGLFWNRGLEGSFYSKQTIMFVLNPIKVEIAS